MMIETQNPIFFNKPVIFFPSLYNYNLFGT
jgi:hypothetical protein